MEPLDIRDQYILTRAITRLIRPETFRGSEIAPLVPSPVRKFKMLVREADKPWGIGQFKAPNADTPVANLKLRPNQAVVTYVTAVDLEEMAVLEETDLLESADALVRAQKVDEIIDLGRLLALRNERLTEWMRWKAFANSLVIQYSNNQSIAIDTYGSYADTHVVTTPPANPWNVPASSKVLSDLQAWSDLVEKDSGFPVNHVWMRRQTFRYFQESSEWSNFLTFLDRPYRVVTESDIRNLLDIKNVHIYEGAWKDDDGNVHYYLPENYILLTTDPVVDGLRIAEMHDCPVVRARDGRLVVESNPGTTAETFVDERKKQEFLRVATARMITINFPECFMCVRVW